MQTIELLRIVKFFIKKIMNFDFRLQLLLKF